MSGHDEEKNCLCLRRGEFVSCHIGQWRDVGTKFHSCISVSLFKCYMLHVSHLQSGPTIEEGCTVLLCRCTHIILVLFYE
jgi:hypothetical protein